MENFDIEISDLEKQVKKAYYERVHFLGFSKLMEKENFSHDEEVTNKIEEELKVIVSFMETLAKNHNLDFDKYLEMLVKNEL